MRPSKPLPDPIKKWGFISLKLFISIGILWIVLSRVGIEAVGDNLSIIPAHYIFAALSVLSLQMIVHAYIWYSLLEESKPAPSFGLILRILLLSLFFNQVLPASVGGMGVRIWLAHRSSIPFSTAVTSVLMERVLYLIGLVLLALLFQPIFIQSAGDKIGSILLYGLTTCAVLGLCLIWFSNKVPESVRGITILRHVVSVAMEAKLLLFHPSRTMRLIFSVMIFHSITLFAVILLARGLQIDLTMIVLLSILPLVFLVGSLPVSINGWGVREAAMIGLLGLLGIPEGKALSLAIGLGLCLLITRLPMGLIWFYGDVRKAKEASGDI